MLTKNLKLGPSNYRQGIPYVFKLCNDFDDDDVDEPKALWQNSIIDLVDDDRVMINDESMATDRVNKYLTSVPLELVNKILPSPNSYGKYMKISCSDILEV